MFPVSCFRRAKNSGMTLIELVIAIAIIAVLFPVMISAFFNPVANAVWGDQMVQAMSLAQEKMEEIYADKANNSVSLGYSYITLSNYPAENPVSGFSAFNRSVTITEVSGSDLSTTSSGSGFKKVVVTVKVASANCASSRMTTTTVAAPKKECETRIFGDPEEIH
jgi:prepilin-type N-terminal cleavage/methylation domain-containing protein